MKIKKDTTKSRFWAKVKKSDGCWEWTGALTRVGYGHFFMGHRNDQRQGAHRVSWAIHNGPIHNGLHVLHRCDNRRCVRPSHLFLGTNQDNQQDCLDKNRNARSRKTHCPHGHPYSPENTIRIGPGRRHRQCLECRRIRDRARSRNRTSSSRPVSVGRSWAV